MAQGGNATSKTTGGRGSGIRPTTGSSSATKVGTGKKAVQANGKGRTGK